MLNGKFTKKKKKMIIMINRTRKKKKNLGIDMCKKYKLNQC